MKKVAEEVSELTQKLARIWEVSAPKSWEEVGAIYEMSGREAQRKKIDWDQAWAGKVRESLPEFLRYRRLKPHLEEFEPQEVAGLLEFFGPMTKMRVLKERGDLEDKVAGETLEVFMEGDPTSRAGTLARMGFIEWWKETGEDPVERLREVGYKDEEIERKFGLKVKRSASKEAPKEGAELSKLEKMKRELERKIERLRREGK